MKTLLILLRKEFILFRKNKFLPKISFIFPCVVILIIPLVTTMDVKHVNVSVVSHDNSMLTERIISDLEASSFFTVDVGVSYEAAITNIEKGESDVILEIPHDFHKDIESGIASMPHISANGVNGIKGSLGAKYVGESVMGTLARFKGIKMSPKTDVTYLYNPTLEYRNYMVPALMIMLLIMICGYLPTLNLVGEKESGTIEQMNVTPVRSSVFVLSKVIPYWIIGIIDLTLAMLIAFLVYDIFPVGSIAAIYLASILFIFVMTGIGIIIANYSDKMSQSMFLMMFVILVSILMSGLFTPISSMPEWAQYLTYLLPPRYYIDIIRSLYLKGTCIGDLALEYIILCVFAIIINLIGALTYRKQS